MALQDSTPRPCTRDRNNVNEEPAAILRRGDQPLVNWLQNQHCDNGTILKVMKLVSQYKVIFYQKNLTQVKQECNNCNYNILLQFVQEDVVYTDLVLMSRSDLSRIGLKIGQELRIWRAMNHLRDHQEDGLE